MTWNGMTEPLSIGDRVRIVGGPIEEIGLITKVLSVWPPGTSYTEEGKTLKSTYMWYDLEHVEGMEPEKGAVDGRERPELYKLPPDWDERTHTTKNTKKENA